MAISFEGVTFSGGGFQIEGVQPPAPGQQEYTTAGTYSWVAPAGVTSVCVVCISGGSGAQFESSTSGEGGQGGTLAWKNNIPVTPGQSYTVVVGSGGQTRWNGSTMQYLVNAGESYFIEFMNNSYCTARPQRGGFYGDGGGLGGFGWTTSVGALGGGGGGCGGYSGNGGNAGRNQSFGADSNSPAAPNSGGAAGGISRNGGGGVGIYGLTTTGTTSSAGGSGGTAGDSTSGGTYGGGGPHRSGTNLISYGGKGAVRIIWGDGRAFPSTNTANV